MHVFAKLIFLSSIQSLFCIHNFVPSYPGLKLYKLTFQYLHILTSFQTISSRQRFTHGVATLPKRIFFPLFFFNELAHTTGTNTECLIDQVRFIASANLTQTQQSLLQKALHECKTTMHMYSMNSVNTRHTFLKNPDTLHQYANRHTFLKTQTLYTCRPIDTFFSRLKHFTPESQQTFFSSKSQTLYFSMPTDTLFSRLRHFSQDPLYTSMSTDTLFSRPKHFTPVCQQTHFSQDPNTLHQYANQVVDTAAPVQCMVWIGVQAKTYTRSRKKAKSKAKVPGTNTKWHPKGRGWLVYNNHVTFMLVVHMPGAFYSRCFVKTAFLHKPQNRHLLRRTGPSTPENQTKSDHRSTKSRRGQRVRQTS